MPQVTAETPIEPTPGSPPVPPMPPEPMPQPGEPRPVTRLRRRPKATTSSLRYLVLE